MSSGTAPAHGYTRRRLAALRRVAAGVTIGLVAYASVLAASADAVANAGGAADHDKSAWGEAVAAGALVALSLLLFATGRKRPVALRAIDWGGTRIGAGRPIPGTEQSLRAAKLVAGEDYKIQRGRFLRGLYLGKDGRWSTSKMQPLLWTYAVLFGLLALVVAKWLGDSAGWDEQVRNGLQDQYLVLLGGPFAAAVLAKLITTTKDENGILQKTDAGEGAGRPTDLFTDDAGDTDLVDLQYSLFNLLALAFFLGTFCFNLHSGFPDFPDLLVGLTTVSGATYVAKKATERQRPRLKAVIPAKGKVGENVEVFGENLLIGSLMQPPPADWVPKVLIGGRQAVVAISPRRRTGADRLEITVPDVTPDSTELEVYTANGTLADGTLPFEVLA